MVSTNDDAAAIAVAHICSVNAGIKVDHFYMPTHYFNLTVEEIADHVCISTKVKGVIARTKVQCAADRWSSRVLANAVAKPAVVCAYTATVQTIAVAPRCTLASPLASHYQKLQCWLCTLGQ